MQDDNTSTTTIEMSSENVGDGLTRIGGYTICTEGLAAGRTSRGVARRRPIAREHVEIAKEFLKQCRREVLSLTCPINGTLKHDIERWAGCYISRGAVIVAAIELDIGIAPFHGYGPREEDELSPAFYEPAIAAVIGINARDVERVMMEAC
jgi:hypothetical protein